MPTRHLKAFASGQRDGLAQAERFLDRDNRLKIDDVLAAGAKKALGRQPFELPLLPATDESSAYFDTFGFARFALLTISTN